MRGKYLLLSAIAFVSGLRFSSAQIKYPYRNANLSIEKRITDLLSRMTLDEKVGQLNQLNSGPLTGPEAGNGKGPKEMLQQIRDGKVGSLLNVVGAVETGNIQKIAVTESRLGIPLLFALDVIHGYKTIFPIPIAESCSWDPDLAEKCASAAAKEASASGLHWTFAPMMDLTRDPRWGRVMEGAGEDPYLGGVFAAARVRGFQGNLDNNHLLACVKHFAGYGAAESGREYNTVDISRYNLWNMYLPPYKAAVDAGAATVMNSFNIVDGIPASANKYLNTEVLRKKWKFRGFMVSDWSSFSEMINHGFAENKIDAAEKAILSGSQMDMESGVFIQHLKTLISSKKVPQKLLDNAVRDILYYKFKLGLFDNPYKYHNENHEKSVQLSSEMHELSKQASCKSMVLLKNENGTLPLDKNIKNILVVGNLATNRSASLDFWSAKGDTNQVTTYLAGIKSKFAKSEISFSEGYNEKNRFSTETENDMLTKAQKADVVIAVIGISGKLAGEARSLADIAPASGQMEMLRKLHSSGKKVIVLVHAARPMILTDVLPMSSSILYCWIGGTEMGAALAEILAGDYNPSAKLTMSFPHAVGQIPVYYNSFNTGRPHVDGRDGPDDFWVSRYRDIPNAALFPFGFGLSYTSWEYSNLELSSHNMDKNGSITCTLYVKNKGPLDGEEIVQLYIRDVSASYVRPIKELKSFKKLYFKAGESKKVEFTITPSMLSFYDPEGNTLLESGSFTVFVGKNSKEVQEASFVLK